MEKLEEKIVNITGHGIAKNDRLIENHKELLLIVEELRKRGLAISYTVGVYDMHHIGHARYLEKSKECADVLIVGIDSDAFTKARKGEHRPIVSYEERWEMLAYNRFVNIITVLNSSEEATALLEAMKPDVIIMSFSSVKDDFEGYAKRMHEKYDRYCKELVILPRQAETSTSARLSQVVMDGAKNLTEKVEHVCDLLKTAMEDFFKSVKGGGE